MKWLLAGMLVLMMTMSVTAQMTSFPMDIPAFSSPELMIDCIAQYVMGNTEFVRRAMMNREALIVPKGTTIILGELGENGIFPFMIKGRPGLWYSAIIFMEK